MQFKGDSAGTDILFHIPVFKNGSFCSLPLFISKCCSKEWFGVQIKILLCKNIKNFRKRKFIPICIYIFAK